MSYRHPVIREIGKTILTTKKTRKALSEAVTELKRRKNKNAHKEEQK